MGLILKRVQSVSRNRHPEKRDFKNRVYLFLGLYDDIKHDAHCPRYEQFQAEASLFQPFVKRSLRSESNRTTKARLRNTLIVSDFAKYDFTEDKRKK